MIRAIFSLFFISSFFLSLAFADIIYLKNGKSVNGIIESETAEHLIVNIGPGEIQVDKDNINTFIKEENTDLEKLWENKYIFNKDFVPERFSETIDNLNLLKNQRIAAISAKQQKEKLKKSQYLLDKKMYSIRKELDRLSQKLSTMILKDNQQEYSAIVERFYSLQAELQLADSRSLQIKEELPVLNQAISKYISELNLFESDLDEKAKNLTSYKEQNFVDAVNSQLAVFHEDFTAHIQEYTMRNDNIIVRGVINNTVVCEFVVDTGASIVLLPYKVADRLSLINSNGQTFEATLANGEKVPAQLAILKKLQVGESYAENVQAGILLDRTRDYPGLLGMSFLKNFIIKINYNESKLQLEDFTPE